MPLLQQKTRREATSARDEARRKAKSPFLKVNDNGVDAL